MSRSEILQLARTTFGVALDSFVSTASSGVIAAATPARSVLWAWNLATLSLPFPIVIERLRLKYTCLTAFTTPVTAGRQLAFGTIAALGATVTGNNRSCVRKSSLAAANTQLPIVANTGPVTADLVDLDTLFARLSIAGAGASGNTVERTWEWNTGSAGMLAALADSILVLTNPVAMDAAGTFEVTVEADVASVPDGYPSP